MKTKEAVTVQCVKSVYSGYESELWELLMGEQLHIGGMESSLLLSDAAKLGPGMKGIDLCCYHGAGMRFLVRIKHVESMRGVDFSHQAVLECRKRSEYKGFVDCIQVTEADVTDSGLPSGKADFIWAEDSWCSVVDKEKLIQEAARLVRFGGTIAFTDLVEGPGLTDGEADRVMGFMKFPSLFTIQDYTRLLEKNDCKIEVAEDTGLFPKYIDMFVMLLSGQQAYDALRCLRFDEEALAKVNEEMRFVQKLVKEGKLLQARFIAKK